MKKVWCETKGAARLCRLVGCLLIVGGAMSALSGCSSGGGSTVTPTPVSTPTPTPTGNPGTQNAPRQLFGQWRLVNTSGGITGSGYTFTPGTEFVTFNEDGTFSRVSNGQQATQGTYQVNVAPFNTGELNATTAPIITYSTTSLTEDITEVSDTRLVLSERAADGYVREYERVVNTSN